MSTTRLREPHRITSAQEWNARYPESVAVRYFPTRGRFEHVETRTRSGAWEVGDHAIVLIDGQSGGVHLDHLIVSDEQAEPADGRAYVLDSRSVVGNCCTWWRPEGKGYTCDLSDAGLYLPEKMESRRDTDVLVSRALADSLVVRHVRIDHLQQHMQVRIGPLPQPRAKRGRRA